MANYRDNPLMPPRLPIRPSLPRQGGMVLITSLIFLVVLTLIGVTAMRTTTLQERMAGNLRDTDLGFQAAEAGLRSGEQWLYASHQLLPPCIPANTPCVVTAANPVYPLDAANQSFSSWWQTNATAVTGTPTELAAAPRYIVEYIGNSSCASQSDPSARYYHFRITSASVGATSISGSAPPRRVLQSAVTLRDRQC